MSSNFKRNLSRVGGVLRRQLTHEVAEQGPMLVIDHDELTARGHCAVCFGLLEVYVCQHTYLKDVRMCEQHKSLPAGRPGLNFTATEAQQDRSCPPCRQKVQHEKEYALFQFYRDLSSKKWHKEKDREVVALHAMERARAMTQEEWNAEKLSREALLAKKEGIVCLSVQDAAAQKNSFQRMIVKETVKQETQLAVRQATA